MKPKSPPIIFYDANNIELKVGQLVAFINEDAVQIGKVYKLPKMGGKYSFKWENDFALNEPKTYRLEDIEDDGLYYIEVPKLSELQVKDLKTNKTIKIDDYSTIVVIEKEELMIHFL